MTNASLLPPSAHEVKEGELLWAPTPAQIASTNLADFSLWLQRERGRIFLDYHSLWQWSVDDIDGFWQAIWDYFKIESSAPHRAVLAKRTMPGAEWFPGARLNFVQHVLRQERPGTDALLYLSETTPLTGMDWADLAGQVRILATQLRKLGIEPGDRVAAYMPNIPQTLIAMLATTAIGAIWSVCSPDYGARGALDRLQQLSPKILFCVDGYRYGGKPFHRDGEIAVLINGLDQLQHVVALPYLDAKPAGFAGDKFILWHDMLDHPAVAADDFEFAQMPFDHPLWILFSSGTTGLPKAIVHGHGGILLEMFKLVSLHMDLKRGERMFFFSTTGWMMWNFLASALLLGVCPVLYDGNPSYPDVDVLWKMAQDAKATFFGASPTYVDIMAKAGIVPGERYDLSSLRAIMPAGSPVTPAHTAWFYRNVKSDLWIATGSGGTDCCTGYVGGVPTLPVYAGEIQAPSLGVSVCAFDDQGNRVIDEVGEMVITKPMPSMPLRFWNDGDNLRYKETYFADYVGIWRQGDFFRVNQRGGCFVLGRSDATLNRFGIRIGTAEIYRVMAEIFEIDESLIVNLDLPGGKFFMPLFVKLKPGMVLSDALIKKIADSLRREYTPRHVPDRVIEVPEIPFTMTGKKLEVPVRKILLGIPAEKAANMHTMASPTALNFFVNYAATQQDYERIPSR